MHSYFHYSDNKGGINIKENQSSNFFIQSKNFYNGNKTCNHQVLTDSDVPTSYQKVFLGRENDMHEVLVVLFRYGFTNLN